MPQQLREFTGTGTAAWNAMADVLRPRFQVAADRTRALRRVWLDTFDWRLCRVGRTLEYISGTGMHELAFVTPEGERMAAEMPRMTWPRVPGTIPAGVVRERVASPSTTPLRAAPLRVQSRRG